MNLTNNFTSINGILVDKVDNYYLLKSMRDTARKNEIRIWNLPESLYIGEKVNIIGELAYMPLCTGSNKKVLGVKALMFFEIDQSENDSIEIVGEIVSKDKLRITPVSRKKLVEFFVKIKDGLVVPVHAWGAFAEDTDRSYRIGDRVYVNGYLYTREYLKVDDGQLYSKLTTEVSANYIEKLQD